MKKSFILLICLITFLCLSLISCDEDGTSSYESSTDTITDTDTSPQDNTDTVSDTEPSTDTDTGSDTQDDSTDNQSLIDEGENKNDDLGSGWTPFYPD